MAEEAKAQPFAWPPLESDPTILTNYLHKVGKTGIAHSLRHGQGLDLPGSIRT